MTNSTSSSSASAEMSTDDWLEHGDYSGGSFFKFDLKKEEARVWLHPKSAIRVLWRVVWKYLDDEGKLRLMRWNSMEHPETLAKFNFKSKEDPTMREHQPQVDPFCKLIEWVDQNVAAGKIGWTDEIFKWSPEDGDEESVLAGGFGGDFQSKHTKEDPEKRKIMRKAGVRQDEAFKHNHNANEETVFIVVDNKDPSAGPQIATCSRGISKAFKEEVQRRKRAFPESEKWKGDPFKNPVCFSWVRIDSNNAPPKYSVGKTEDPLTAEIQAAFDQPVPDTKKMFEKSNVAVLEKQMKAAWCHEVVPPWKDIFGAAYEAVAGTPAAVLPEGFAASDGEDDEDEDDVEETKKEPPKKVETKPAATSPAKVKEQAPVEEEEADEPEGDESALEEGGVRCDVCDGVLGDEIFASDPIVCPHCGAKYEETKDAQGNGTGEFAVVNMKAETPKEAAPAAEAKPEIRASRRQVTH